MKRLVLTVVAGLCCSLVWGEEGYHIFTDTTGRAITARILTFDARKQIILVQMENGRQGKIPLAQLSDADKEFVQTWNTSKDFMDERRFKISAKRVKRDNDEKSRKGYVQNRDVENMGYELQIENRSDVTFENISLEYCIFYEQEINTSGGEDAKQGVYHDKMDLKKILPKARQSLETKSVLIYKEELSADYHWVDGTDNVQRGEVHGIWVKASLTLPGGDTIVRDFCLPDSLANSRKWTTKTVNVGMN